MTHVLIAERRRDRLFQVEKRLGGRTELVRRSGKSKSYISALLSGTKDIGEAAARELERVLVLGRGYLDDESYTSEGTDELNGLSREAAASIRPLLTYLREVESYSVSDEATLLAAYRRCDAERRALVLKLATSLATGASSQSEEQVLANSQALPNSAA